MLVAYIAGFAHGVRLGRTFTKPQPRSRWISADYDRLALPLKQQAAKYVRRLLKEQEPPAPRRPTAAETAAERASLKGWMQRSGREARAHR